LLGYFFILVNENGSVIDPLALRFAMRFFAEMRHSSIKTACSSILVAKVRKWYYLCAVIIHNE